MRAGRERKREDLTYLGRRWRRDGERGENRHELVGTGWVGMGRKGKEERKRGRQRELIAFAFGRIVGRKKKGI